VDAVRHPVAADDHGFAGRGVREAADDRHSLAVFVSQAQHGVAVLFIQKSNIFNYAGKFGKLIHKFFRITLIKSVHERICKPSFVI